MKKQLSRSMGGSSVRRTKDASNCQKYLGHRKCQLANTGGIVVAAVFFSSIDPLGFSSQKLSVKYWFPLNKSRSTLGIKFGPLVTATRRNSNPFQQLQT
jgi:hypothetical protein